MKLHAKVVNGKIEFADKMKMLEIVGMLNECDVEIEIKKVVAPITKRQFNAMHLYYRLVANKLNDAGISAKKVFEQMADVKIQPEYIKEMWRLFQIDELNKKSTTELTRPEVSRVYDRVNKHLGEKFGIHVAFPDVTEQGWGF